MTSGIYKLTFKSGQCYIGKSIHMEERMKQHCDKFNKGTAAKNMQEACDKYGAPTAESVIIAHPDHLDMLESFYINIYKKNLGNNLLNGVVPKCISDVDWDNVVIANQELLKVSTVELFKLVANLKKQNYSLQNELEEAEEPDIIFEPYCTDDELEAEHKTAIETVELLEATIFHLRDEIKHLKVKASMPWYKRIFS